MKRSNLIFFLIVLFVTAGTVLPQTPPPTKKEIADTQEQKGKPAATNVSSDTKATAGDNSKLPDKAAPLSDKAKKARDLLNQCYQEALESDPVIKVGVLTSIARIMTLIDRKRAIAIYETAFASTWDLHDSADVSSGRNMRQSRIADDVAVFDIEKGLELALQIEPMNESGFLDISRAQVLFLIARRVADKDPERAFGIVREEISRTNFVPSLVVPMALALQKKRPDLAEVLYLEAIRQFDKPVSDPRDFKGFVDTTVSLFDLNKALTIQAVEIILRGIDYLAENPPKYDIRPGPSGGETPTTYNGVREYAILKTLPLVQRLDPERAKGLEKKFAVNRARPSTVQGEPAGQTGQSAVQAPPQPAASAGALNSPPSASAPPTPVNKMDGYALTQAANEARRAISDISRLALQDPAAAQARYDAMAPGPYRVQAMAQMAMSTFRTDPEKAKGLLTDAASAAEKISDPCDRGNCDDYIARGYLLFDQERAREILKEAFTLADQAMEEENKRKWSPNSSGRGVNLLCSSQGLIQTLVGTLARINIDDAIARAQEIKDKEARVQAMVQIANAILTQK